MIARLLARLGRWLYRLARKLDPDSPPWPELPEVTYTKIGDHARRVDRPQGEGTYDVVSVSPSERDRQEGPPKARLQ